MLESVGNVAVDMHVIWNTQGPFAGLKARGSRICGAYCKLFLRE